MTVIQSDRMQLMTLTCQTILPKLLNLHQSGRKVHLIGSRLNSCQKFPQTGFQLHSDQKVPQTGCQLHSDQKVPQTGFQLQSVQTDCFLSFVQMVQN
ncbi:hypothetical protein DPMN_166192 [Dreissena polymorpha]|uniref:Uncharacterized protein n=1 Tax=Dreissena polymorpha TaxID=45954 RepID=A0A9D4IXD1_DREPO|nr:hypothetical protein DPMN_166192 [Dreissena polymorpha]